MLHDNKVWLGTSGDEKVYIYPKMANRHGMIAGATGTGKTITLKVLAESFSKFCDKLSNILVKISFAFLLDLYNYSHQK